MLWRSHATPRGRQLFWGLLPPTQSQRQQVGQSPGWDARQGATMASEPLQSDEPRVSMEAPADARSEAILSIDRCKEALELWLQWNEAYETVTAAAFKKGFDQRQLEAAMDQMDRIRARAIALSAVLLGK
ncbi:MAG: hypothetical protein HYX69_23090 [Planctomycetia bacterium]|nr:hypothetical protein [Planctomycetia bacterium]